MMIRKLVFGAVLVLTLGTTTIAYANDNSNQRQAYRFNRSEANTMYSMMEQYGYGNGYGNMAAMMKRIDTNDMIQCLAQNSKNYRDGRNYRDGKNRIGNNRNALCQR